MDKSSIVVWTLMYHEFQGKPAGHIAIIRTSKANVEIYYSVCLVISRLKNHSNVTHQIKPTPWASGQTIRILAAALIQLNGHIINQLTILTVVSLYIQKAIQQFLPLHSASRHPQPLSHKHKHQKCFKYCPSSSPAFTARRHPTLERSCSTYYRGNKKYWPKTVQEVAKHLAAGQTVLHIRRVPEKRRMKKQEREYINNNLKINW